MDSQADYPSTRWLVLLPAVTGSNPLLLVSIIFGLGAFGLAGQRLRRGCLKRASPA